MFTAIAKRWRKFEEDHETSAQFVMFFLLSNGVTVLQLILMPVFKAIFNRTSLVDITFQIWPVGTGADGVSPYYVFDYASGALPDGGGVAGLLQGAHLPPAHGHVGLGCYWRHRGGRDHHDHQLRPQLLDLLPHLQGDLQAGAGREFGGRSRGGHGGLRD